MGGQATFSGTTYQAGVIAFIYVHTLAQTRLGWLAPADDTPAAVSGETSGPGDDARIEFGEGRLSLEIQAKHGLTAGAKLQEVIDQIQERSTPGEQTPVAIIVDRTSSSKLHRELARDLDRLRTGRQDVLGAEATRLLRQLSDPSVLHRISIVAVDVDRDGDPERKVALQLLTSVVEDAAPSTAAAAWAILVADAGDLCARRLRRTRRELVDLLAASGVKVRPPTRDERWHRQLDFTRLLLKRRRAAAAQMVLSQLQTQLGDAQVDASVRYRLEQQRAAAALQLNRHRDALDYSRHALDVDPDGVHALVIAAGAALSLGDPAMAQTFADHAVRAHPEDPSAWAASAHVASARADTLPTPPSAIAGSALYRTELATIAAADRDWLGVLTLTEGLLAEGVRTPEVLLHRANGLLSAPSTGDPIADRDRDENAERLATELIDALADDGHPLTVKALVLRATARQRLGQNAQADADLGLARGLRADDPDAIAYSARMKIDEGDEETALQILYHPVVDDTPALLAFRARILAMRDDGAARRDAVAALRRAADTSDPDNVRLAVADTALLLKDLELAQRALGGLSAKGLEDARFAALKARLALLQGRVEDGIAGYHDAAQRDSVHRTEYLAELGSQLLSAGNPVASVSAFGEVGLAELPAAALKFYGRALMEVDDLIRAQELVDRLAKEGPLPDWALGIATDIALRQDDVDGALRHLTALVERAPRAHVRIELARRLLERNRNAEAASHIDALLNESSLSPVERMQTAQLLDMSGRHNEALELGFRAFRAAPHDSRFHRVFIILTLRNKDLSPTTETTGPDTHVLLRDREGRAREYTIYADPPLDPIRGEISTGEAKLMDLLNKKVGDVIVRNEGTWQEEQWTIEGIKPAIVHVAQDAMSHYEERFPGQPFFIKGFSIGDGTSVKDLTPIIGSLEDRRTRVLEVFKLYRDQTLPLGFIVKMLGGSIPEAMGIAISHPDEYGPLVVEWSDEAGQDESRSAASEATTIVLTRSALKTAQDLHIVELLPRAYTLVAPMSLRGELQEEVLEAEGLVADGHTSMASYDNRFQIQELRPGHPALREHLEEVRALWNWLEKYVRLDARPLAAVRAPGSREEQARDLVGHSSYDAVSLTQHLNLTMFADDLGLRRLVPKGTRGRSFSTVGLLPALAQRGLMTGEERDRHLHTLVMRNYMFIPPSRELLETALDRSAELQRADVAKAFALLAGPAVALNDAASMVAQAVKSLATSTVQLSTIRDVVQLGLEAMERKWSRRLSNLALERAASAELTLLPTQLDAVRRACAAFRQ